MLCSCSSSLSLAFAISAFCGRECGVSPVYWRTLERDDSRLPDLALLGHGVEGFLEVLGVQLLECLAERLASNTSASEQVCLPSNGEFKRQMTEGARDEPFQAPSCG
jgi:hypothetical protein